jgi:hypothetical protein
MEMKRKSGGGEESKKTREGRKEGKIAHSFINENAKLNKILHYTA